MEVIAVINQKGGVGKSITAHAIGAAYSQGHRVLYVDLDAQGNLATRLGPTQTASQLWNFYKEKSPGSHIEDRARDIIASSPSLAGADTIITALQRVQA